MLTDPRPSASSLAAAAPGAFASHDDAAARVVAVVLCWNDDDRVIALLERLRSLEPGPGRVVVVDNGSSDLAADRLAAAFPQHQLLRLDRNLGYAAAANRGIGWAIDRGADWVWLLNTDLELPCTTLASLLAAATNDDRSARSGLVAPVLVEADGRVQARGGGRVSLRTGVARHVVRAQEAPDYLSGACLLARTEMLREIGSFDEGYFFSWEDIDLGWRARAAGWRLAVAGDCFVVHDEGSTLGRWSAARWELLFRGMHRFLRARARFPRVATLARFAIHATTMLRRGRIGAVRGAARATAGVLWQRPLRAPAGVCQDALGLRRPPA